MFGWAVSSRRRSEAVRALWSARRRAAAWRSRSFGSVIRILLYSSERRFASALARDCALRTAL